MEGLLSKGVYNLDRKSTVKQAIAVLTKIQLNLPKWPPLYNSHYFLSWQAKNPYIDSYLKPLYNGHFFTAILFYSQGGHCGEVQLYVLHLLVFN